MRVAHRAGDLQGEARLADTAGAGQREQPHPIVSQQRRRGRYLLASPEQGCRRDRQRGDIGLLTNRTERLFGDGAVPHTQNRCGQGVPILGIESQGRGQQVDCGTVRGAPLATLQVANRAPTEVGQLGQFFLRQAQRAPMASQKCREIRVAVGRGHFS